MQASLDLARCYFEQQRLSEIAQLAGEMFPHFNRFRHDPKAYGALNTFHQATIKGRLRAATITAARSAIATAGAV